MSIANQKFQRAAQITSAIHQSYSDYAKKFNLNYNELVVLQGLFCEKNCTQTHICTTWALPKQTVHNICKKYIELGLIDVLDNPADKRTKLFALNAKGREFALPIIEPLLALEQACVAEFGETRTDDYLNIFNEFQEVIKKHIGADNATVV
ncbi:MarR family [Moraxella lacunata]|uniref:MarR family n=1 Tax=Moraxella lacunata TaxID=477 RepID=A0A378TTF4_MORLA|nr:MarR family winged helix-turn-helix transcriptional regulator [Moraxella lacunata]STZ64036.1 MarR family [Moraxella lacunata]